MTCAAFALRVANLFHQAGHQYTIVPLQNGDNGAIRLVHREERVIIDSSARRVFALKDKEKDSGPKGDF